jgi:nucleoside 2-deoxyribosyltransferase
MEVEIRTARFLIADLTHGNRGAYWEAGFAAGLGKPVFYTCEEGYFRRFSTHFDTNHHYIVMWNAAQPDVAVEELKAAIRATLPGEAKMRDN